MNCPKRLRTAAVMALALAAGTATANPGLSVGGVDFASGAVFSTVSLWQGNSSDGRALTSVGDMLTGVGRVNLIEDGAGGTLWNWGGRGTRELTLHFTGFDVASVSSDATGWGLPLTQFGFIGGTVRLYADGAGNSSPVGGATAVPSFTDGVLWLELAPRTLESGYTLTATQVGSQIIGLGYLDVVGGLAASYFDTDPFAVGGALGWPPADVRFETLGILGFQGSGWDVTGAAKVEAFAVVPIPGSFALLGSGLAWLAVRRRRKET